MTALVSTFVLAGAFPARTLFLALLLLLAGLAVAATRGRRPSHRHAAAATVLLLCGGLGLGLLVPVAGTENGCALPALAYPFLAAWPALHAFLATP